MHSGSVEGLRTVGSSGKARTSESATFYSADPCMNLMTQLPCARFVSPVSQSPTLGRKLSGSLLALALATLLGIALAITSAARGAPVRDGLAAFGELGLTGRLRAAAQSERRLEECKKLRIATVLAPEGTTVRGGHRLVLASTLREAMRLGVGERMPADDGGGPGGEPPVLPEEEGATLRS